MARIPILSPNAAQVARIVHRRIIELGIGTTQASRRAGLSASYVTDLLRGQSRNPKRDELEKLASVLGMEMSDFSEIQAVAGDHVGDQPPYTDTEIALIDLWRLLSDEGRDLAFGTLAKLLTQKPRRRQANNG